MTFAEKLKSLREAAGLSQQALSGRAGIALGAITKIEQGQRPNPSWRTVQALAKALGVKCDEFQEPAAMPRKPKAKR